MATKSSDIRKRILKQRGVELEKMTRKPVTHDDIPALFFKTHLMKYIELKFGGPLKSLIFNGTIYKVGKRLGIDASTVSKWRKAITEADDKKFWEHFNNE